MAKQKKGKQINVSFNQDQYNTWLKLKKDNLTSLPFSTFVKDAFHDKVDDIKIKVGKKK